MIFDLGQDGRANRYLDPGAARPLLPGRDLRDELPLPDNSELDVVRHFTRLSQQTFGIDLGVLSARIVHDEVQPARQRRAGDPAGVCAICTRTFPTSSRRARCRSCTSSSAASVRSSAWRRSRSIRRPARTPNWPRC